jgi:hypothetical protein
MFPSKIPEYLVNPSALTTSAKTAILQSERFSFDRPNLAISLFFFRPSKQVLVKSYMMILSAFLAYHITLPNGRRFFSLLPDVNAVLRY